MWLDDQGRGLLLAMHPASELQIRRAGRPIRSFLSVLGRFRETRLTATLAYLVSRFPEHFLPALGLPGRGSYEVIVEETAEGDRFDVVVGDERDRLVIEAKVGLHQDLNQLVRYARQLHTKQKRRPSLLLIDAANSPIINDALLPHVRRVEQRTWTQIATVSRAIARSRRCQTKNATAAAIASDFVSHLEENQMLDERPSEIYLRELSTPHSVELYFRHHIYKCQPQFLKSARGNLYFAPYFTARASTLASNVTLVPIGEGISYISRLRKCQLVPANVRALKEFLRTENVANAKDLAELIRAGHDERDVLVLLLGPPYQMFTSPVLKSQLRKVNASFTPGTLGSRSCTLEELLGASHGGRTKRR